MPTHFDDAIQGAVNKGLGATFAPAQSASAGGGNRAAPPPSQLVTNPRDEAVNAAGRAPTPTVGQTVQNVVEQSRAANAPPRFEGGAPQIQSPQSAPRATFADTVTMTPDELEALRQRARNGDTTAQQQLDQAVFGADGTAQILVQQAPGPTTNEQIRDSALGALAQPTRLAPQFDAAQSTGATLGRDQVDFGQVLGLGARNQQQGALSLQEQAAFGNAPSVAAIQQQQGLDSNINAQFALANSARGGPAAQMLAQRQAQTQAATLGQAGVNQAAALRASEMATARDAFFSGTSAIRAGDLGATGIEAGLAGQVLGSDTTTATVNAQLEHDARKDNVATILKSRGLDDIRVQQMLSQLNASDLMDLEAQLGNAGLSVDLASIEAGIVANRDASERADRQQNIDLGTKIAGSVLNPLGAGLAQLGG